jgi:DNA-binding NarL/FixJ family response regulator
MNPIKLARSLESWAANRYRIRVPELSPPRRDHQVPVRILIADDHEAVRRGVSSILQSHDGVQVCGEATNGREAIEKARELKPDLVILDVTMPVLGGLEAAVQILKILPSVPILFFSMHESRQLMEEAQRIGARGYVTKGDAGENLLDAVQALSKGKTFFHGFG